MTNRPFGGLDRQDVTIVNHRPECDSQLPVTDNPRAYDRRVSAWLTDTSSFSCPE